MLECQVLDQGSSVDPTASADDVIGSALFTIDVTEIAPRETVTVTARKTGGGNDVSQPAGSTSELSVRIDVE
ncbi:MAG: hypothetical protein KY458_10200 [Actinobacteria bacterium]|nr:hypothetical protein [Actinomycetota bacterium]